MRGTEVVEWVAGSRDASGLYKVLTNIVRSGGLTVEAPQGINWDELLPPRAALSILHLGHAGLLIRGGQSFVAVDPWFVPSNPRYRKPPLQSNQLPTLEAVFLTHEHWDHVNEQSLLQYPNHVPIIVPRQPTDRPLQPRFREFLELFGFEQVVELGHWEHHVLSNGLVVTAVPFLGEGSADEGSVRNCYLVERAGKRVFVHVDSSLDSFNRSDLSEGVIDRLVADHGPVDVLYATRRQELHFGFECISDFYPIFLGSAATRLCGVTENCHCPASYLAGLARDTRCALMVLYSEGGAEWYPFSNFLRGADGDEQFAGYDFLWDSFEDIVRQVGVPVRLSRAMDVVIVGDVIEHVISAETQPAERSQADDED